MTTTNPLRWPFVLFGSLSALLMWALSYILQWWQIDTWQTVLVSGSICVAIASALSLVGFWWIHRPKQPVDVEQKHSRKAQQQHQLLVTQQLDLYLKQCWQHGRSRSSNPYNTPWYFMLGDAEQGPLLQQLGLSQLEIDRVQSDALPVSFWRHDNAIVILLEQPQHQDFENCTSYLLKQLNKRRARQGANGVLIASRSTQLLGSSQTQQADLAASQRQLIKQLNRSLGLNLPIYLMITDMLALADFCQCFASFDEQQLENPFGALQVSSSSDEYDPEWFSHSFDALQKQLAEQTIPGLQQQLTDEYRQSIIAGPYQFSLLRPVLESYCRQLLLEGHFESQPLSFRGYFFVNAQSCSLTVDPLSMLQASELGLSALATPERCELNHALFTRQLLERSILSEFQRVGVNRRREHSYRWTRTLYLSSLVIISLLVIALYKVNYDHASEINAEANTRLASYQQKLEQHPYDPDDLTAPIANLTGLREITLLYQQPSPWYIVDWLPTPSIQSAVDKAYYNALDEQLLTALRDYLEKDLYVYNSLDDKVRTLELYNLWNQLYNPRRQSSESLENYYVLSLQAEGSGDKRFLDNFKTLMDDLLVQGTVPEEDNPALIKLVSESLASQDLGDVVYQQMVEHPKYSRRIDLSAALGQNYRQVFQFDAQFDGLEIPYMFTRQGFLEISNQTGFQLSNEDADQFRSVVNNLSDSAGLNRVDRNIRRRYIEDYISHWQRFINATSWRETEGWEPTRQQFQLLANPAGSPLNNLYTLISEQTDLLGALTAERNKLAEQQKAAAEAGETETANTEPSSEQKLKFINSREVALAISQPFEGYQHLMEQDENGNSPLKLALSTLAATDLWLQESSRAKQRGELFINQLAGDNSANPLREQMLLASNYSGVLGEMMRGSASQLNDLVVWDVHNWLQQRWQAQVTDIYRRDIARFYPFNPDAAQGVSLASFAEFFGPSGHLANFRQQHLAQFNIEHFGNPALSSFLPDRSITLSDPLWQALDMADLIQQSFFKEGQVGIDFSLRSLALSQELTELSLSSDKPLYEYRNGPSLWQSFSWPAGENQSQRLNLRLKSASLVVYEQEYNGPWNWFRLAADLQGALTREANTSTLKVEKVQHSAQLLLRTSQPNNPFYLGFFQRFNLPAAL